MYALFPVMKSLQKCCGSRIQIRPNPNVYATSDPNWLDPDHAMGLYKKCHTKLNKIITVLEPSCEKLHPDPIILIRIRNTGFNPCTMKSLLLILLEQNNFRLKFWRLLRWVVKRSTEKLSPLATCNRNRVF